MSTPLIPKLFVEKAAGGLPHLAERLWSAPHPQLWGYSPAVLWNSKAFPPLATVAHRQRILNVFAPSRPTPERSGSRIPLPLLPVRPVITNDEVLNGGNGKSAIEISREEWNTLFGDVL